VTEDSWRTCNDPETMMDFLEGRSGSRQLRLFACACCRRIWPLLTDERSRRAVETAEQYADGVAGESDRETARREAYNAVTEQDALSIEDALSPAVSAAAAAGNTTDRVFIAYDPDGSTEFYAALNARRAVAYASPSQEAAEGTAQCHLLRDIFGLTPFRPLPPIPPSLRDWHDGLIGKLAHAAYDNRLLPSGELDPARLAILCDALLDAGCPPDHELVAHLRGPGPHVRGCHGLDLILGKA
jgi:hypothetical protein